MRQNGGGGSGLLLGLVLGGGMVFGLAVVGFVGLMALGMGAMEISDKGREPQSVAVHSPASGGGDPLTPSQPQVLDLRSVNADLQRLEELRKEESARLRNSPFNPTPPPPPSFYTN